MVRTLTQGEEAQMIRGLASQEQLLSQPWRMNNLYYIQDKAGNHLKDYVSFSFSTVLPAKVNESYAGLAAKYSPLIYQATSKTTPQFDYPTSYDFDGQWKALL